MNTIRQPPHIRDKSRNGRRSVYGLYIDNGLLNLDDALSGDVVAGRILQAGHAFDQNGSCDGNDQQDHHQFNQGEALAMGAIYHEHG